MLGSEMCTEKNGKQAFCGGGQGWFTFILAVGNILLREVLKSLAIIIASEDDFEET